MGYEVTDLEGVTVCASWLNQALYLPLNSPLGFFFPKNFCISYIPEVQNVAYVFPSCGLCLDRTSDNCGS